MTALLFALAVAYIFTASPYIVLLLAVDFFIRAFTTLAYSPLSWIATQINRLLQLPVVKTDKAKKIFSARIGFLFALAILLLSYVNFPASVISQRGADRLCHARMCLEYLRRLLGLHLFCLPILQSQSMISKSLLMGGGG